MTEYVKAYVTEYVEAYVTEYVKAYVTEYVEAYVTDLEALLEGADTEQGEVLLLLSVPY